jgi:inosine/xanthosine triphosphatase
MKIAVGTQNKAKLSACELVFTEAFPGEELTFMPFEVETGVSNMPMSNEETFAGALNRANALKELTAADYYVGLEGGVQQGPLRSLYLLGWAAVIQADTDKIGAGHSGGMRLPPDITSELLGGAELGPLIQARYADEANDIRQTLGTNGLLTKGLYVRSREFEDAIRCALGELL